MIEPMKSFKSSMFRRKNLFYKFIGISTAAAFTVRFLYPDFRFYSGSTVYAKEESSIRKDNLVSVHLFTRHGARTPLHMISGYEQVFLGLKSFIF